MAKNEFELKKIKRERIELKEEDEKRRIWFFFTFFSKYGSILGTLMTFSALAIFLVGAGLSLSTIDSNSKRIHEVKITAIVEYLSSSNLLLIDTYPMSDADGIKQYEKETPASFRIINQGVEKVVSYIVAVEDLSYGTANAIDTKYLRYQLTESENIGVATFLRNDSNILVGKTEDGKDFPKNSYILSQGILRPGETQEYVLKVWLSGLAGNDQQGKEFKAKINVYFEFES